MSNLKYLSQKLFMPEKLQNQIQKLQNSCNILISKIVQCKKEVIEVKTKLEYEAVRIFILVSIISKLFNYYN